jgi:hypothetical protein
MKAPQITFTAISLVFVGCGSTPSGGGWWDKNFQPSIQQGAFTEFDATCLEKWQGDVKQRTYSRMYPFVLYVEKRDGRHFSGKICYQMNSITPLTEWSIVRVEGEVYEEISSHPDARKWTTVKQIHALSDVRNWWVFNEVEAVSGPTWYLNAWDYVCIDGKGKMWGGYFDSKAYTTPSCIFSGTRKK